MASTHQINQNLFKEALIDSISDSIISTDLDGKITCWNKAAEELYKWKSEDVIGKTIKEIIPSASTIKQSGEVMNSLKSGDSWEGVVEVENKYGKVFPVYIKYSPLLDKNRNLIGIIVISKDITESKVAQNHLLKKQFYLSKAQEISKIGTWELDLVKNNLIWTRENYKIFGVPVGTKMNYELFLNCVHPEDREYVNTEWTLAVDSRKTYGIEHRLLVNNEIKWVREEAEINYDSDGNPISAIGFTQDITKHKLDQLQVLKSEAKYKLLFENMGRGHALHEIIFNKSGKVIDYKTLLVNRMYEKFLNVSRNSIIGKKASKFLPKEELNKWLDIFGDVALTGNPKEYRFYSEHNKKFFEGIAYCPEKGKFAVSFSDVTHHKKAEEKARQQQLNQKFLNSIALHLADKHTIDEFSSIILNDLKEHTGASLAVFSYYHSEKKELQVLDIEAEKGIFNTIVKVAGKKITGTASPVDDSTYQMIVKDVVASYSSFAEVTFGAIPELADKAIRAATGIDRLFPIAHVIEGELYGTTMLAFKKGQASPSLELLESYAHLMSVSLRRFKAEKALQDSELKYRRYVENSPLGILVVDEKGKYIDVNQGACKLLGYTRDDLLQLSIPDVLADKKDIGSFQKLKEEGKLKHELKLKKKDETVIDVRLDAVLLPDSHLMAFHADITERKKTEEALRQSEHKYRNLFNSMQEGVYLHQIVYDDNGNAINYRITEANDISEKILNIKKEAAIGQLATDLFGTKEAPFLETYSKVAETGMPYTFDRYFEPINKHFSISAFSLRKGEFATVFADVTVQKKSEEELKQAKEKAEESDRLKSAFLANMSHEIRTPMNGIFGFTDLLKEPGLSGEQQQQYIEIIQKSGNRMLNTVNDIIEISRIETGEIRISSNTVNINKHLLTLHDFFSLEAEKKGLSLVIDNILPDDNSLIVTDKSKLGSVLSNLIKNAIKFTDKGSIKIGCKQNKEFLEFYVEDNGIGIPADRKDAVFNRFEQADIKDSRVYEGSGLGLAIAKSYVEMLGGKICVNSEENAGSTFLFTIPYKLPATKEGNCNANHKIQSQQRVKLNILVVEDDETSSLYLSTILKDLSGKLKIISNGLEAVNYCKNNSDVDLILMDIKMPGLSGYETTKRIREFNKDVKIIAQTAYAIEGDKAKAIKAGCDHYISKPIKREKLEKIIKKCFNK
ncbi:PAS domain S-box protein [uncultured Draconibacterium sp.]|uniref:PAS domain S-box protein n=1 Tax=uncultured Draconibacterium sp. TaxID=1573823 RepID=UPI0029C70901|nr:PAS domain S-box protein [uncultured Draconibacterium sp.]